MSKLKPHIPNLITMGSVACGFAALINLVQEHYVAGMWLMFFAILLDGIDGKTASLLGVKSDVGSSLDSLSDVISFGLVPGVSMYLFYYHAPQDNFLTQAAAWVGGIGVTLAGVLRETRFLSTQLERTRAQGFIGLPIAPPAGLYVAFLALANLFPDTLYHTPGLIVVFLIVTANAYLMTRSTFVYGRWRGRYIAIQTAAALLFGAGGYIALGTGGGFLAVFFIAFSAEYIIANWFMQPSET